MASIGSILQVEGLFVAEPVKVKCLVNENFSLQVWQNTVRVNLVLSVAHIGEAYCQRDFSLNWNLVVRITDVLVTVKVVCPSAILQAYFSHAVFAPIAGTLKEESYAVGRGL